MADWLLVVPRAGAPGPNADTSAIAQALRAPTRSTLERVEVRGAVFSTVAESRDDPGIATVRSETGALCAVVASALLTEREDLVATLRSAGRDCDLATSDGILLAHVAALWGEDAWARPGGEFAVAAWDPDARSVILATDGEGARPIFWASTEGGLVASTRFEAMMVAPMVRKEPDRACLVGYLSRIREPPESSRTWLRDVNELPPGHVLRWRDGLVDSQEWRELATDLPTWSPRDEPEAIERFRLTLRQSLVERLRGHQRVAIALSGGIDSSAVAAEAVTLRDRLGIDLVALHAQYPPELQSAEASFAEEIADRLRLPFATIDLDAAPYWPPDPAMRTWPPHHWFGYYRPFASALAENGSAVLTGASGEIFARASLTDALESARLPRILSAWRSLRQMGLPFRPWSRKHWRRSSRPFERAAGMPLPSWIRPEAIQDHGVQQLRRALALWTPGDVPPRLTLIHTLLRLFRGSSHQFDHAAARLPMLDPFADRRVVRLAVSIDPVPWRIEKYLVRRALDGILPSSVLRRARTPTPWLAKPFFNSHRALEAARVRLHPVVDELIDSRIWRSRAIEGIASQAEGKTWLAPLVVSLWLHELETPSG